MQVHSAPRPAAATGPAPADALLVLRRIGVPVLLGGYLLATTGWLVLGLLVALARYWPGFHATLAGISGGFAAPWARGVLAAAGHTEPLGQVVLDYLLSALNLVVAGVLWWFARRDWTARLLAAAVIGSAGAFNLQAHTSVTAVEAGFGWSIGWWHILLLHGVSGVAYVLALLVFPTGRLHTPGVTSWPARVAIAVSGLGVVALLALSTAEIPHTVSFVAFFGILTPLAGLIAQRTRSRYAESAQARRQSRLLFTALVVALGIAVLLGLVTLGLWLLGTPGLTMSDPTAHSPGWSTSDPTGIVFYLVRLIFAAIPIALLVATRWPRNRDPEGLFSRALTYSLMVVVPGAVYAIVVGGVGALVSASWAAPLTVAFATVVVAVFFQPVRIGVERLLDRLIYGSRPDPYAVLAQVASLAAAADHAQLAAAIARGLGADRVVLTLHSPALGDRRFRWPAETSGPGPDLLALPVRYGAGQVGVLELDRPTVASLIGDRRRLLDDLVDVLGPVLHDTRLGLELAHQLRTVLRRADEITASRRQATTEMDSERRGLERNLHDGAQHHLVALRLTVGLVEHELHAGHPDKARQRVAALIGQVEQTQRALADTAAGVFPVTLAEHGLVPALTAELRDAGSSVTLDTTGLPPGRRFPLPVETAVYFTCLEAVNNARKHAPGATVTVTVRDGYRGLEFQVTDNGPGFEIESGPGRGLHNIADRAESVGGQTTIRSTPGKGTTVQGFIPL